MPKKKQHTNNFCLHKIKFNLRGKQVNEKKISCRHRYSETYICTFSWGNLAGWLVSWVWNFFYRELCKCSKHLPGRCFDENESLMLMETLHQLLCIFVCCCSACLQKWKSIRLVYQKWRKTRNCATYAQRQTEMEKRKCWKSNGSFRDAHFRQYIKNKNNEKYSNNESYSNARQ